VQLIDYPLNFSIVMLELHAEILVKFKYLLLSILKKLLAKEIMRLCIIMV